MTARKMQMPYSQYQRIESKAGGVHCSVRSFIRAARSVLSGGGKSRAQRKLRHEWIRSGLREKRDALRLYNQVMHGRSP